MVSAMFLFAVNEDEAFRITLPKRVVLACRRHSKAGCGRTCNVPGHDGAAAPSLPGSPLRRLALCHGRAGSLKIIPLLHPMELERLACVVDTNA